MSEYGTGSPQRYAIVVCVVLIALVCTILVPLPAQSKPPADPGDQLTGMELLGKYVFYDKISNPPRMACVTCHDPATGGTGSVAGVNLHQVAITGADPHTVGNLKPPTNAYATFIDVFHKCNTGGLGRNNYCGGNFWDGRAEGNAVPISAAGATKHIGDEVFYTTDGTDLELVLPGVRDNARFFGPVADQALNPMPNPVEQNITRQGVCQHVKKSKYAKLYKIVWGVEIDCSDAPVAVAAADAPEEKAFDISFKRLMLAVCAWQGSPDLNSFSSRRDVALRAELACACQDPNGGAYPGEETCGYIQEAVDPAVCVHEDYINSPGEFPLVGLTDHENLGHDLFYGIASELNPEGKNANCANCHTDNPPPPFPPGQPPLDTGAELFQVYSADDYHNIGTPRNPELPVAYNSDGSIKDPELGIAGHMGAGFNPGFFKTATVRNVDKRTGEGFVKAYTHNGWFKSLESIVHFYNTAFLGGQLPGPPGQPPVVVPYEETTAYLYGITRCPPEITTEKDALANNCWPAPAYPGAAIPFLIGDLKLTLDEEAAIVDYMKALTDLHTAKAPKPYK